LHWEIIFFLTFLNTDLTKLNSLLEARLPIADNTQYDTSKSPNEMISACGQDGE